MISVASVLDPLRESLGDNTLKRQLKSYLRELDRPPLVGNGRVSAGKVQCPSCERRDVKVKEVGRQRQYDRHLDPSTQQWCIKSWEVIAEGVKVKTSPKMRSGEKSELWKLKIAPLAYRILAEGGVIGCEFKHLGIERETISCAGRLTLAHVSKQRRLSITDWLTGYGVACLAHHDYLDLTLDADEMWDAIEAAIARRGWQPTIYAFREFWGDIAHYFGKRWIIEVLPILEQHRAELIEEERLETLTGEEAELLKALNEHLNRYDISNH